MHGQLLQIQPKTGEDKLNVLLERLPHLWSVVHLTHRDRWTWRVYNHNRELIAERDELVTVLECALTKTEPSDQRITWDSTVPGLGLRAKRGGAVWILKYRCKNRQIMKVIGDAETLTEKKARVIAKRIKQDAKKGIGPEPHQKQEAIRIEHMTVESFCKEYIDRYAKPRKKSWLKDKQRLDYYILPVWRARRLAEIKHSDISRLHSNIGKSAPIAANRLLEVLSTMFKLAISWGYLPIDTINPANGIAPYPNKNKTRWLNDQEIERLFEVLNRAAIHKRAFFYLLLLTGCRSSEILHLKWRDIQMEKGFISLDETKNGEPHWLPLSTKALEILKSLPQQGDNVFPGMRVDKAWAKIRKEAQLDNVRIHDLRHTVASRLIQSGHSLRMVGEVLNHKSLSATGRYAHLTRENLRGPLEALAESMAISCN